MIDRYLYSIYQERLTMIKYLSVVSALVLAATTATATRLAGYTSIPNPASVIASMNTSVMAPDKREPGTSVYGEPQPLGNGTVRSFISLDANKNPLSIGVTFTKEALSGLPTTSGEYALSLPPAASSSAFRYVLITWNPQGHQPTGTYDVPHFDFHFYSLSPTERQRITAVGDDRVKVLKNPAPAFIPTSYTPEPTRPAPGEGRHWIDTRSPEFRGQPFTKTFIYGTYDGAIVFAEPMLTKVFLESYPNTSEAISLPKAYSQSAYYPTHYSVNYNQNQKVYSVSLDRLTFRSQSNLQNEENR